MSEAETTAEEPVAEAETAAGFNSFNSATPNGYWPTPEQAAEQRRQTALHIAASLRAPGHTKASEVLDDAKMFDVFISGAE